MRIHQITPSIAYGDAISNHIFEMDARFRQWGYEAHIFVQFPGPIRENGRSILNYKALEKHLSNHDDLFIYHYGVYHPGIELFQKAQGKKILVYHNITPSQYFVGWDGRNEDICNIARTYLECLSDCDFALGDSDYNRRELVEVGFDESKTAVLPIFLTLNTFETLPFDNNLVHTLQQNNKVNWLTVGRVVPNKAIENVIRIFYVYQSCLNPNAHLYIVGACHIASYKQALEALIDKLGLREHITFAGKVTNAQLKTYYSHCDLYIAASHHEGFCVPLIESMYFNLPILAHDATAIPETLDDAGVLYANLGYEEVAAMAHLILSNPELKQQILLAQQNRLQAFAPELVEKILHDIIFKFT